MSNLIRLVGENQTVEILGVKLLGVNAENGKKIIFSAIFIAVVLLFGFLLKKGTASKDNHVLNPLASPELSEIEKIALDPLNAKLI